MNEADIKLMLLNASTFAISFSHIEDGVKDCAATNLYWIYCAALVSNAQEQWLRRVNPL